MYSQLKNLVNINLSCLHWKSDTVVKIARRIENEKLYDDLPILADALEEAGADSRIINLCRQRTKWVLQALLEKV